MSGRIKVGYYVEVVDFDANDPRAKELATSTCVAIQEAVDRRTIARKQNIMALPPASNEIDQILTVMEACQWQIAAAAKALGTPTDNLYNKLARLRDRGILTSRREIGFKGLRWQRADGLVE